MRIAPCNSKFSSRYVTDYVSSFQQQVTLDIIGHASFGMEFACLKDPENKLTIEYAREFAPSKEAQKYRMLALVSPKFLLDHLPPKRNQELRSAVVAVSECASRVIVQRCAALDGAEKQSSGASRLCVRISRVACSPAASIITKPTEQPEWMSGRSVKAFSSLWKYVASLPNLSRSALSSISPPECATCVRYICT